MPNYKAHDLAYTCWKTSTIPKPQVPLTCSMAYEQQTEMDCIRAHFDNSCPAYWKTPASDQFHSPTDMLVSAILQKQKKLLNKN